MTLYQFLDVITDTKKHSLPKGSRLTERRQHCMKCGTVLALELTDNPGFGGDYYVIADAIILAGEFTPLYKEEKWFGNHVRCPKCGSEGKLPMDKPLNWDNMQKTREDKNA